MELLNSNTNFTETASEPRGVYLLQSNHMTEDEAVNNLRLCCREHPFGCGSEDECKRRFDIRAESWRLRPYAEYKPRLQTTLQKYADSLPQLNRSAVIGLVRERAIY
jgi:hypothetical protein